MKITDSVSHIIFDLTCKINSNERIRRKKQRIHSWSTFFL